MKQLLIILTLFATGCTLKTSQYNNRPIITSKSAYGQPELKGISKYTYRGLGYSEASFDDSSNKYNIGDTIK